jgi:hypothetical protein
MTPGKVMGELAILYNCKRTATIKGKIINKQGNKKKKKFEEKTEINKRKK